MVALFPLSFHEKKVLVHFSGSFGNSKSDSFEAATFCSFPTLAIYMNEDFKHQQPLFLEQLKQEEVLLTDILKSYRKFAPFLKRKICLFLFLKKEGDGILLNFFFLQDRILFYDSTFVSENSE